MYKRQGYFDTEELFMLDTLVGGKNLNDHALVEVLANEAKNGIEWLKTSDANLSQDVYKRQDYCSASEKRK